jgi:hypothetical protein
MPDQALALQVGQNRQLFLDRAFGRTMNAEHEAHVDHVQHVQPQIAQIVMHRAGQFGRRHRLVPGRVFPASGAQLGDDHQVIGVGVQRFLDDLVGDMRAIEIAGVDMVDAAGHRFAQHGNGGGAVFRRSEGDLPCGRPA